MTQRSTLAIRVSALAVGAWFRDGFASRGFGEQADPFAHLAAQAIEVHQIQTLLIDEVGCAGGQGVERGFGPFLCIGGEHDDPQFGSPDQQLPQHLQSVGPLHLDIQRHDIGIGLGDQRERLLPGRGLAHDLDAGGGGQHFAEGFANERRIINYEDPDHAIADFRR